MIPERGRGMPTFPERLSQLDEQERTVLTHLLYEGPATRQQLQAFMGLSSSSMARLTGGLSSCGLIEPKGEAASGGGRKAMRYGIGQASGLLVGVELSRTEVRVRLTRPNLTPLDQFRFSLGRLHSPEITVDSIANGIRERIHRLGASLADVPGIGIGTAGQIDRKTGILRHSTGFSHEGWQEVPLCRMLSERLEVPAVADNGVNMAVLAERLAGSGKGLDPLAYVHLGMGVRTGILSGGSLLRHIGEGEDAFGHLSVNLAGNPCHCGNRGCLETVATLPALASRLNLNPEGTTDHIPEQMAVAFETAEDTAGPHREVIVQAGAIFGAGLASLVRLMALRLVILSGPVVRLSPRFYQAAVTEACRNLHHDSRNGVLFERDGHFGEWAIATGAAAHVLDSRLRGGTDTVPSGSTHSTATPCDARFSLSDGQGGGT